MNSIHVSIFRVAIASMLPLMLCELLAAAMGAALFVYGA